MEYHSAGKKKRMLQFAVAQVNPEGTVLGEISQRQILHDRTYAWNLKIEFTLIGDRKTSPELTPAQGRVVPCCMDTGGGGRSVLLSGWRSSVAEAGDGLQSERAWHGRSRALAPGEDFLQRPVGAWVGWRRESRATSPRVLPCSGGRPGVPALCCGA